MPKNIRHTQGKSYHRRTTNLDTIIDDNILHRQLLEESYRRKIMEYYRQFPMVWLSERLKEDPKQFKWSLYKEYKNYSWDGDKDPLLQAWKAISNKQWVGVESATSTGKTFFLSRLILWFLDTHRDALVVTTAPKQSQLKLHLWSEIAKIFHKFKNIRPSSELLDLKLRVIGLNRRASAGTEQSLSDSWQAIGFVSGTSPGQDSVTTAQGFHRENMLIILEETPGISQAVINAFENTCTGKNNVIIAVGNPDNEIDTLHKFSISKGVKHIRISALDYPNIVTDEVVVPGAVTQGSIDRRRDKYGKDSPFYLSRVRGISPAQSSESLIMIKWVEQCFYTKHPDNNTMNAVGVDVARSKSGDMAALAWGNMNNLIRLEEFQCPDASHLAYNLIFDKVTLRLKGYTDYNCGKIYEYDISSDFIGIDVVGVGASTIETLANEGHNPQSLQGGQWKEALTLDEQGKPLYNFVSLRAMMYWYLREDLRMKRLNIHLGDKILYNKLLKELITPKYIVSSNTIKVEAKENIIKRLGYSPNLADAVAYWNFARYGYRLGAMFNLPFK